MRTEPPAAGITYDQVRAYATWATKTLLSPDQWDRAHQPDTIIATSGIAEWCQGPAGPVRRGPGRARTGFRCATPLGDMLALLAI